MKIKVGGRYVARNGEVVDIVCATGNKEWRFKCSRGHTLTETGRFIDSEHESIFDLLYEFKDDGAPSKPSTILTVLFWLAVIIATIGFWGMAAVKLWQMMPGN